MTVCCLQNAELEAPGTIGEWAEVAKVDFRVVKLFAGEVFPALGDVGLLIVMGGPMNVYEEAACSWLRDEKAFVKAAIDAGKRVVGICIGAQIITDVLGGKVTKNPEREVGWHPITLTDEALRHPALAGFPKTAFVFEWHEDTFSTLAPGCVHLAASAVCAHQLFSYRRPGAPRDHVFGLQFHLENTPGMLANYADAARVKQGRYVQRPEQLLGHPEYLTGTRDLLFKFLNNIYNT
jgi:GMP synthase-like glutamine amidotransferase